MRNVLVAAAIAASVVSALPVAAQETFKCKTPAGTVYQDRPCAGVRYAAPAPAAAVQVPPATSKEGQGAKPSAAVPVSDLDRQKAYIANQEKTRRIAAIKEEVEHLESLNATSQRQRDAELDALRARQARANNNLAGATLEQSLATQMQAVTDRYASDVAMRNERIRALRAELDGLK